MARDDRREWASVLATGVLYLAAASGALAFTRFDGGPACLWVAGAVLLAKLGVTPRRRWPPVLAVCGLAHFAAAATFGVSLATALPLTLICLTEALVAAALLQRIRAKRDLSLDSVAQLGAIVISAGVVAPALAAVPAALLLGAATGAGVGITWYQWFAGHALGGLTFWPVLTVFFSGEAVRWAQGATPRRRAEALLLLASVALVTGLVFVRPGPSLLFLPVVPVMLATFRIGRAGAAASVLAVALVGGWLTLHGLGPVVAAGPDPAAQIRFFQLYLAATVLTALPAASELRRQRLVFDQLRDSEARYRLLADNSGDIVLSAALDGTIAYASPSAGQLGGLPPDQMVGLPALTLVHPDDRDVVRDAFRRVLREPDVTIAAEYRIATAGGEDRWFESRSRGVRDDGGRVTGSVSAIRDVTQRRALEAELARAAATDPLTGLPNRRVFDAALERLLAGGGRGCVAIFDLDHFKTVNDRFGHEGGDRVLTAFAAAARGAVRDGDLVARLGGEEFGVLLPGAGLAHARQVCERLRGAAAGTAVPLPGGLARITASAGLAEARPGMSAGELMRVADIALYRAKTDGRDRLSLAA